MNCVDIPTIDGNNEKAANRIPDIKRAFLSVKVFLLE
jgi:hypothetical protein